MNREPSVGEIAKALDVPEEDVVLALEAIQDPVSLFEPIYNDGGDAIYIIDQVKDPRHTDSQWLENLAVSEALRRLTEREQRILRMRFFEGRTQMEVAKEVGISQAQVSRLEKTPSGRSKRPFSFHRTTPRPHRLYGGGTSWKYGLPSCATAKSSTFPTARASAL